MYLMRYRLLHTIKQTSQIHRGIYHIYAYVCLAISSGKLKLRNLDLYHKRLFLQISMNAMGKFAEAMKNV